MDKIITIKQQVYHILKRRIADGTYRHGQRLQENDLAADLMVSRSPIREALKQLVLEGILEETPNKGVSLRIFSEKEIQDVYDLRILLECYAIDFLAVHSEFFPLEQLNSIRNCILAIDGEIIDYVVEPQINPHIAFVEATENNYLIDVHNRASFCTMSYHNALFAGENYSINLQQHLDIVDSLLAHDYKKAKEVLTNHLLNSKDIICRAINDNAI
jgi:DNA-binding GntR family transcriptional regulator